MAREINIDLDTLIGYDFPNSTFYITNKETTTKRRTRQEAKNVLDIVAPSNTVTLDDLENLQTQLETLTNLYYTWEDKGAYIKTIQFNTWEKYPLTLDAEKQKLYIMNSDIIYDLNTNEGPNQRLLYIQSFYANKLGLHLEITDLETLYNLLLSYYNPKPYNVFQTREIDSSTGEYLPLRYSNTIILPNFSNKSPATYTLTCNPTNLYTPTEVAKILSMKGKIITLTNSVPSSVEKGMYIKTGNTGIDDIYTVVETSGSEITVDKDFQTEYICETPTLYLRANRTLISSMSMANSTITLSASVPNDILVGDKIMVQGITINNTYNTITLDGEYTVQAKDGSVITVAEEIKTDYTYSSGTQGEIFRPVVLGVVNSVTTTSPYKITLAQAPTYTVSNGTFLAIKYPDGSMLYGTATAVSGNTITVNFTLTNFPTGILQKEVPHPEVLVEIETTTNADVLPTGSFIVDSTAQCTSYLGLLANLETPTATIYNNTCMYVSGSYPITVTGTDHMVLKGLYSEVYHDSI